MNNIWIACSNVYSIILHNWWLIMIEYCYCHTISKDTEIHGNSSSVVIIIDNVISFRHVFVNFVDFRDFLYQLHTRLFMWCLNFEYSGAFVMQTRHIYICKHHIWKTFAVHSVQFFVTHVIFNEWIMLNIFRYLTQQSQYERRKIWVLSWNQNKGNMTAVARRKYLRKSY